LNDVVEEVLYVTDMEKAFAAAGPVRKEAYGSTLPAVSSTILVTPRLALPTQLIEIKFLAGLVSVRDRRRLRTLQRRTSRPAFARNSRRP